VTVTVCPATVSVPVRWVVAVLAATVKLTPPLPEPVAPAVMVIQFALVAAVHEQLVPDVTETVNVLPVDGADTDVGVTV
jgi:hypothetical protein